MNENFSEYLFHLKETFPVPHSSILTENLQHQHDMNYRKNVDSEKESESQMGFETTTLRDLKGCSNH